MFLSFASLSGAERRIELSTLALGCAAAALAGIGRGWTSSLGVILGTALAWANFRWLRSNVSQLEALSVAQAGAEKSRLPRRITSRLIWAYALLLGCVCASFFFSFVPALAVVGGLFSLVVAVLCESVYQLARGWRPGNR